MAATGNEVVKLLQLKTIYDDLASKIGVGGMEFGTQDDIFEDGTNISAIGIKINGIAFVSFSIHDMPTPYRFNDGWKAISDGSRTLIGTGAIDKNTGMEGDNTICGIYKSGMGTSFDLYEGNGSGNMMDGPYPGTDQHFNISGTITYALRS